MSMESDEELLTKLGAPTCSFCGALIEVAEAKSQKSTLVLALISSVLKTAPVREEVSDDVFGEKGFTKILHQAASKDVRCSSCKDRT